MACAEQLLMRRDHRADQDEWIRLRIPPRTKRELLPLSIFDWCAPIFGKCHRGSTLTSSNGPRSPGLHSMLLVGNYKRFTGRLPLYAIGGGGASVSFLSLVTTYLCVFGHLQRCSERWCYVDECGYVKYP